jgi:hypothetical protein
VDDLLGILPASSQHAYIKFGKLAEAILPRKTTVACVPKHNDVPGNEIANMHLLKIPSLTQIFSVEFFRDKK